MLIDGKGYDSDWSRAALDIQGIAACIPPLRHRKVRHHCYKDLFRHRQRHRIENVLGRIKDWRRVATGDDRCANTFMSVISIASTFCYGLWSMSHEPRVSQGRTLCIKGTILREGGGSAPITTSLT